MGLACHIRLATDQHSEFMATVLELSIARRPRPVLKAWRGRSLAAAAIGRRPLQRVREILKKL
jgi:hypothetical protein